MMDGLSHEFEHGFKGYHKSYKKTLQKGAKQLSENIGASFSSAKGPSLRQSVAGFFSRDEVNPELMLEGHVERTIGRCAASSSDVIVVSQDTTYYTYTSHPKMKGLKKIQGKIKGTVQHNVLAIEEGGTPLGLLYQHNWVRKGLYAYKVESEKWFDGLVAVNTLPDLGKRVVLVQDREADILTFFKAPRAEAVDLVVRIFQPRRYEDVVSGEVTRLFDLAESLPVAGQMETTIKRGNKTCNLRLAVSFQQVHVWPNKNWSFERHKARDLTLIVAREINSTQAEPACWLLLTSAKVSTVDEAKRVVRWYALRWRVEQLHFVLKSGGLQLEKLQFDDVHTLFNAMAFYSVVAWRTLFLTYTVRENAQAPAKSFMDSVELKLLEAKYKKKIKTVGEAVIAIARLEGFAPTKKYPYPGVKKLSQALVRLNHMVEAISLWKE